MNTALLLLLLPFAALTPLVVARRTRGVASALMPLAALPALASAVLMPPLPLTMDWLLAGATLGFDTAGRVLVLATGGCWTLIAWYALYWLGPSPGRMQFLVSLLAVGAGAVGVCIAQDMLLFYTFYTLLVFGAYGAIIYLGGHGVHRIGELYIVLSVLACLALFEAMILAASASGTLLSAAAAGLAGSPSRDLAIAMLLIAFGAQAGLPLLHVAIPLACRAAPLPAAAALLSVVPLCGLLGWLRFLPLGMSGMPGWGAALGIAGLSTLFIGTLYGLTLRDAKALLAYLGVAQAGVIFAGLGAAMAEPELWPVLGPVLMLYAVSLAAALVALCLGLGLIARIEGSGWVTVGLGFAAAMIAGVPLSGGGLARAYAGDAFAPVTDGVAVTALALALPASAALAVVQGVHFIRLVRGGRGAAVVVPRGAAGLICAWAASLVLLTAVPVAWMTADPLEGQPVVPVWDQIVPLVIGGMAAFAIGMIVRGRSIPELPPGDAGVLAMRAIERLRRGDLRLRRRKPRIAGRIGATVREGARRIATLEAPIGAWPNAGTAMLVLVVLLVVLLAAGR